MGTAAAERDDAFAAMTARELESLLLARCVAVARTGGAQAARDPCEANVFRLAAMVVQSAFPRESQGLMQASEQYFSAHPADRMAPADVVRKGWVLSLPRLRDMLGHRLKRA
ncbi:MAG: hypothetical protein QM750_28180 [Rubrivivax sp.]